MSKRIVWEHWEEPEDHIDKIINSMASEDDPEEDFFPENDQASFAFPMMIQQNTPFGLYAANDPFRPTEMFDCWILHTNFDLDKSAVLKIAKTPGVEAAKLMTRYRCSVGISPMFDIRDVRTHLQESLCGNENDELVEAIRSQISHYKEWAIYKDGSGAVKYIHSSKDNDGSYASQYSTLEILGHEILESSKDRSITI